MANKYAIVNTQLNQMNATLIEQLNGRQGDSGRVVNFSIRDGETPHDISNQNISLVVKDSQGKIKVISTITNIISSIGGLFSMVVPAEMYQAAGEIEVGYLRIADQSNVVLTSIPITFNVVANNVIMTSNASNDYIDTVQKMIDDANDKIKILGGNIDAQSLAFKSLQTSLQNMNDAINQQQLPTKTGSNTYTGDNVFTKPVVGTFKPTTITDGTDFDSLVSPGHYQGSGTFPNSPYPANAVAYDIYVEKLQNGFIVQKINQFGSSYVNSFMRAKVRTNWQDYERIRFNRNKIDVYTKVINVNGVNISLTRTDNVVMFNIQSYTANTKYAGQFSQWGDSGVIPVGFRPSILVTVNADHGSGQKQDGTASVAQDGLLSTGTDGGIYTRMFDMPLPNGNDIPFIQASGAWITRDDFPAGS